MSLLSTWFNSPRVDKSPEEKKPGTLMLCHVYYDNLSAWTNQGVDNTVPSTLHSHDYGKQRGELPNVMT